MSEISPSEIRQQLESLRAEVGRVAAGGIYAASHSDWSAHGRWSSGSKELQGELSISTHLGQAIPEQVQKVISDSSSERFLEVARSLRDMMKG